MGTIMKFVINMEVLDGERRKLYKNTNLYAVKCSA